MMSDKIHLIGTSHIAKESVKVVKEQIQELKPEIVALELDPSRLYALTHKTQRPKNIELIQKIGLTGFLFYLFGEFVQKKLGKIVNLSPGSEMLVAIKAAKKVNSQILLIDRNIEITLNRFSKHVKKRELVKIIFDVMFGFLRKQPDLNVDLKKVPSNELIEYVLNQTKERYPSLYKVLVDERDRYMAKALFIISKNNPEKEIIAVVGAGHLNGITNYLSKLKESN